MPLNWNKINEEDSSVSGYESTHEDDELAEIQSPKIFSQSALTPKSLTPKASFHDLIAQNLDKLSMIELNEVWLFAPKPYSMEQTEDVTSLLKNNVKIKKVSQNSAGWNFLVSDKDEAKQMILNGYQRGKITLKFYASNKNSEFTSKNGSRKGSTENFDDKSSFDTPHKLRKVNYEEQKSKKKIKYQEKVSDKKMPPRPQSIERKVEDKKQQSNAREEGQEEKIAHTQIQVEKDKQIDLVLKTDEAKLEPEQDVVNSDDKEEDDEINEGENEGDSPGDQKEEEYDSEESLQRMRKALKRKNKKMNKKKPGSKQETTVDKNNPFSLLT